MTAVARIDVATNDAGARVRRQKSRELAAGIVQNIYRLVKLAQLHAIDNQAVRRQLDATAESLRDYALRAGEGVTIFFARGVVFFGGEPLKASRAVYEAAVDLASVLERCGGSELSFAHDVTLGDVRTFVQAVVQTLRDAGTRYSEFDVRRIRLRAVSDAALLRGLDVESLDPEQRVVRTYASAIVVLRRFFEELAQGFVVLPKRIKRIAQSLVDLSAGRTPAFLGVTAVRNANHDDAGRAVNSAILAVAMARQVTDDKVTLTRIAMAAMLHDVGRPRALRAMRIEGDDAVPLVARLGEDAELAMPAGTAAVLTALGRVNEPSIVRSVVAYEALWLRRSKTLGPLHRGLRPPTLHARIVATAHAYNHLLTPEPGEPPRSPADALLALDAEANASGNAADKTVMRLLMAALGVLPPGTLVQLSTGEMAVVVDVGQSRLRLRIVLDAHGGIAEAPIELYLGEDDRAVVKVVGTDPSFAQRRAAVPSVAPNSTPSSISSVSSSGSISTGSVPPLSRSGVRDAPSVGRTPLVSPASGAARTYEPAPVSVPPPSAPSVTPSPRSARGLPNAQILAPSALPSPPPPPPSRVGVAADQESDATVITHSPFDADSAPSIVARARREEVVDDEALTRALAVPSDADAISVRRPPTIEIASDDIEPPPSRPKPSEAPPSRPIPARPPPSRPMPGGPAGQRATRPPPPRVPPKQTVAPASPDDAPPASRRPPPPTARPTPDVHGTMARSPLPHLLVHVLTRGLSGSLLIRAPSGDEHLVVFDDGAPQKARTTLPAPRLGELLVERAVVSAERVEAALARAKSRGLPIGKQLVMDGALGARDVIYALRLQLVARVAAMLDLPRESPYEFYTGVDLLASVEPVRCEPLAFTLAVLRSWNDAAAMDATLARLGDRRISLHRAATLDRFDLSEDEEVAVEWAVSGGLSYGRLLEDAVADREVVRPLMYALAILRHLDLGVDAWPIGVPKEEVAAEPGFELEDAGRMSFAPPAGPFAPSGTGVSIIPPVRRPPDAASPSAASEPFVVSTRHHEAHAAPSNPPPSRRPISDSGSLSDIKITEAADDAESDLGSTGIEVAVTPRGDLSPEHAALREMILARATGMENKTYYELLGVEATASAEDIQAAYLQAAKRLHPDRLPASLAELKTQVSSLFSAISQAHKTLSDAAAREAYDQGGGPNERRGETDEVERVLEASALYQKAEVCLKRNDRDGAEKFLRRAVELDPETGSQLALLGWVVSLSGEKALPGALDMLHRAVKLADNDDRALYYRGTVLKRLGRANEAIKDFRKAADLNPKNLDAVREVRLFEMRSQRKPKPEVDDDAGLFGKLFKKKK